MKKIPSSIQSSRKMDLFELVPYLLPFTKRMEAVGFTTLTINTYSDAVCHFGTWLHVNSISPCAITNQTLDQFSTHCCDCSGGVEVQLCLENTYVESNDLSST